MSKPSKERLISLVLGGARSGKSTFAEKLASSRASNLAVLYVATLEPYDAEMQERVERHRASRPDTWRTLEAPLNLAETVRQGYKGEKLVLLDCLTLWTTNRLMSITPLDKDAAGYVSQIPPEDDLALESTTPTTPVEVTSPDYFAEERAMAQELESLVAWLREQNCGLVMVSNEVGMGLVPPYPLGRAYRDALGRLNQVAANLADEAFFCIAGIPIDLKKLQYNFDEDI
ncbi:MAG: bifunctional adenosylcobinamide kinase/adenosylcobinamide-phosphate guanylyltransferase [Chloroflexi bacterium]|uniref:Adenosylcobinamide kinase n=1 Tax=Candidatus Chlorohelix allophototropha TaxID=3003348 RepID=A0A8T7M2K9_9CHLR|nr:bifunctional adenosylcobinamide kinase/adenosylcobinamide-phosphate guanylyltransferase [Chloroflexota bacterium]WJW66563.1 bifunctional adenosylcobinamide kinase/adenosylcobinamide-phosphate guanylyltransferase [Chloroflexota bacterium L227-S17]